MSVRTKATKKDSTPYLPPVIITLAEYNRRKKVWDERYEKARNGKAYERFQKQMQAMKRGDLETVKELAKEAREELANRTFDPTRPKFNDPETDKRAGKLGVKEWLLGLYIREATPEEATKYADVNRSIRNAIEQRLVDTNDIVGKAHEIFDNFEAEITG